MPRKQKPEALLVRMDNWPGLLEVALQERARRAFAWGKQDCCMFAAAMVKAMTGRNLARGFAYKGKLGAAKLLKREGGVEGLIEGIAARYGLAEHQGVFYARRGDVCLIKLADGEALGICMGAKIAGAGPKGVEFVPLAQAKRAWRVG
jgi:hypothetical protein